MFMGMGMGLSQYKKVSAGGNGFNPIASNLRQLSLTSQVESGGPSYTYTSSGDGGAFGSNGSIALATDGSFEVTVTAVTSSNFIGLAPTTAFTELAALNYGMGGNAAGGFTMYDNGSTFPPNQDTTFSCTAGQLWRLRCLQKTVIAEVFSGGVWNLIHIFATARTAALFPCSRTFNIGNILTGWTLRIGQAQSYWIDNTVNFVFDGNSLVFRDSGAGTLMMQMARRSPVLGSRAILSNVSVDGQTTRQMNGLDGGSSADVDAAWVAGKKNVLVAWEGTNSIWTGARTGAQAAQDMWDYIVARQAVHTWDKIVVGTTIPRQGGLPDGATLTANNNEQITYDALIISNAASKGYLAVNNRGNPDTSFLISPPVTDAGFAGAPSSTMWFDPSPNRIHLNDSGNINRSIQYNLTMSLLGF